MNVEANKRRHGENDAWRREGRKESEMMTWKISIPVNFFTIFWTILENYAKAVEQKSGKKENVHNFVKIQKKRIPNT